MYKLNNMVLDHVVIIDVSSVQVSFYSLCPQIGFSQSVTFVKIIGKYLILLEYRFIEL